MVTNFCKPVVYIPLFFGKPSAAMRYNQMVPLNFIFGIYNLKPYIPPETEICSPAVHAASSEVKNTAASQYLLAYPCGQAVYWQQTFAIDDILFRILYNKLITASTYTI
jgi:hypothetical protein